MVKLRAQKAQVEEYNANARMQGMESLGQGIGGLLGNYASGSRQARRDAMQNRMDEMSLALDRQKLQAGGQQDILANQMRNQANPPRAMAVDPRFQAAADIGPLPGQISYKDQPINPTVATGGAAGMKNYLDLGRGDIREQRANLAERDVVTREALAKARMDKMESDAIIAQQRQEVEEAKYLRTQASPKYKEDLANVTSYNKDLGIALKSAAGAKDQAEYDKAVQMISNTYAVGEKHGYKLAYPQIPSPAFYRQGGQKAERDIATWQGKLENAWGWTGEKAAIQTEIEARQKTLQQKYPNYQYEYPGPQSYELQDYPKFEDYLQQGGAAQPSQMQQQGPPPSAAAPGAGGQTISLQEAQKINPNVKSGDYLRDKFKNRLLVQ